MFASVRVDELTNVPACSGAAPGAGGTRGIPAPRLRESAPCPPPRPPKAPPRRRDRRRHRRAPRWRAASAERGVRVVVFEMNPRPYGKIEDGLPRWHAALRQQGVRDDRREARARRRRVRALHEDRPRRRLRGARARVGLLGGGPRERRLARPPAAGRGRRRLRRPGPDLPEPVHHLVQPRRARRPTTGERFDAAGRRARGRRRARFDRRREGADARDDAREAARARHRAGPDRARGEGHPEVAREARAPLRGARPRGLHALLPPPRRGHAARRRSPRTPTRSAREKVHETRAGACSRRRRRSTASTSSRSRRRKRSSSRTTASWA